jgi:Tectonin domain
LWAETANGALYYTPNKPDSSSNASKVAWIKVSGTFASIVLDPSSDTDIWGLTPSGSVSEYSSGVWQDRGSYVHLAVASRTSAAALDTLGNLYRWNGSAWQSTARQLSQVAVAPSGDIWGINSLGYVWHLPAGSSDWSRIPGTLREIAYGTTLWGLNAQGEIFFYSEGKLKRVGGVL